MWKALHLMTLKYFGSKFARLYNLIAYRLGTQRIK